MYSAWVGGAVYCNALPVLPWLSKSQLDDIQSAMNSAVRAVARLPRFGIAPVAEVRRNLEIPTIVDIKNEVLAFEAWKRRDVFFEEAFNTNRRYPSRSNDLKTPIRLPQKYESIDTVLRRQWNSMPIDLRYNESESLVKEMIRKLYHKF